MIHDDGICIIIYFYISKYFEYIFGKCGRIDCRASLNRLQSRVYETRAILPLDARNTHVASSTEAANQQSRTFDRGYACPSVTCIRAARPRANQAPTRWDAMRAQARSAM